MNHQMRYPKELMLKDGTEVMLRPLAKTDAESLALFYQQLTGAWIWYLKEDPRSAVVIKKWIGYQGGGNAFNVVADAGGKIVAHAGILMRPHGGRKHVGRLRVYVDEHFRSKQLGTWMVFDLIKFAMEKGLEMIRCDFVVGVDDKAIEAMRKLDFVDAGLLRNYVKDEKGCYHDYQIMIKHLHKEWGDF